MHVIKKYLLDLLDSNLERAFAPALPPQAHPGRPPTINWPCKSSEQHRRRRICPLQHHPDSASLSMPSKKMGEARDVTGSRFCCTPEGTLLDERHALGRLSTLEIFNRDTRHDFPLQILHGFMHRWVSDQIYFVSVCVCVFVRARTETLLITHLGLLRYYCLRKCLRLWGRKRKSASAEQYLT